MKSQSLQYKMLFLIQVLALLLPFVCEAVALPKATSGDLSTLCKSLFSARIDSTIHSLAELRMKLDLALAKGAGSIALTALRHDYQLKEQELAQHFAATGEMTTAELKERIRQEIALLQKQLNQNEGEARRVRQTEKAQQERQTREMREALDPLTRARKAVFHDIRPGKFLMGEPGKQVEVEITEPFSMMDTQVTQWMWATLKVAMGEDDLEKINPSHFKTGTNSINVNIDRIVVQMIANHPVESVSWFEVAEFIDGLNILSKTGDTKIQNLLDILIPGHMKSDVYDFPMEAQWEFVMRDRGNANKKYFDRDDRADVPTYGWSSENSADKIHEVAALQPRLIEGQPFYDLEGNVWEYNKDSWDRRTKLPGGKDPLGTIGSYRITRGGSWWCYPSLCMRSGYRNSYPPDKFNFDLGFRLVRYRP